MILTSHIGDGLDELLVKHGPVFNLRITWSDLVFTASPEHIKTVLATDFQNYVKGNSDPVILGHICQTFNLQANASTTTWKPC
jgi:hypothetical protein